MPGKLPPTGRIDYYYGSMNSDTDYRRALIATQFHRARRQAAIESLLSRFSGRPADLLSFDEVVGKLGISGQSSLGVQQISIDAIVGSVGRYQDFTRTFLPRRESDEDRWVNVGAAAASIADLPPIEVYKVGDSYFVLDGNHRVSLARRQNLRYIDAAVTEVRTRVPLPPGAKPDALIIAAEQAAFLEYTRLDVLRPDVDLSVSVPGQYRRLENHIEAYRFGLETAEECDLPYAQAVTRWYDEAYLPLVGAIREQGILRYFPGRTETDFFVWLARHRAELQNELGYSITPDVTVARLLPKVQEAGESSRPRLATRLRRLIGHTPPIRTWAEERTLGRYSDHLFATVLLPMTLQGPESRPGLEKGALPRALALADAEGAQLCILCVLDHPDLQPAETAALEDLRRILDEQGVLDSLLTEIGDPIHWTLELAYLNDLIVLERTFAIQSPGEPAARAVLDAVRRPLWIVGGTADVSIAERVLLVHDTRRRFDEALFIAAYLAERWKVALSVLPLSNGRNTEEIVAIIGDYLDLHEVDASFLEAVRPNAGVVDQIIDAARAGNCDLIVLSNPGAGGGNPAQPAGLTWDILQRWPQSVLIAA